MWDGPCEGVAVEAVSLCSQEKEGGGGGGGEKENA